MSLKMVAIDSDGCVRVSIDGPLCGATLLAHDVNPLSNLLGTNWAKHRVMLDLADSAYIDSCAVGWLINCHRALASGGGRLVVYGISARVAQVLQMLRIDRIVKLAPNEAEARRAVA